MSLEEDVRKLMSPTDEDGKLNILYADSFYRMFLEQSYGKEAVDREYDRLKQLDKVGTACRSSDNQLDRRSDREEIEALKSRVRRLKKVVRELTGSSNK